VGRREGLCPIPHKIFEFKSLEMLQFCAFLHVFVNKVQTISTRYGFYQRKLMTVVTNVLAAKLSHAAGN